MIGQVHDLILAIWQISIKRIAESLETSKKYIEFEIHEQLGGAEAVSKVNDKMFQCQDHYLKLILQSIFLESYWSCFRNDLLFW